MNHYLPFWIGWPIKTLNRNFFRSIFKKNYRNMFVIENKLLLSYWRVKSMHYPESPKVTRGCTTIYPGIYLILLLFLFLFCETINYSARQILIIGKKVPKRVNWNKQWYHCREWQSSKILFVYCVVIFVKKNIYINLLTLSLTIPHTEIRLNQYRG